MASTEDRLSKVTDYEEPFDASTMPPPNIPDMVNYCNEFLGAKFTCSREFFTASATMTIFKSNKLEGVGCPISDTTKLINGYVQDSPISFSYEGLPTDHMKARREVLQHFKALLLVREFASSKQLLTEDIIKQWHGVLMEGLTEPSGSYRTEGVFAGQKIFPDHECVPEMMASLLSQTASRLQSSRRKSMWANAAWLSHGFVSIHPFTDGNGRLCRLLGNYVLWYYGFPFAVPISSPRKKYMAALHYADRDFVERRSGMLAMLMLSNAVSIAENHNANQKLKAEFSSKSS